MRLWCVNIGNNFSRLHRGDFESVPQVRSLVLDDSHIREIEEDALGRMDLLEQLSLDNNELTSIPASLPSTSLSALHLEGNRITALRAGDFHGLGRLDQLHLAKNAIVSIAKGTFDQLTRLVDSSFFYCDLGAAFHGGERDLRNSAPLVWHHCF